VGAIRFYGVRRFADVKTCDTAKDKENRYDNPRNTFSDFAGHFQSPSSAKTSATAVAQFQAGIDIVRRLHTRKALFRLVAVLRAAFLHDILGEGVLAQEKRRNVCDDDKEQDHDWLFHRPT
jgi:hypothetical protein